jgi:DNA-directed RNA polymerase specialized sigma subunit
MAPYPQAQLPSGATRLVRRLPAASLAFVERLEHLAYAGLSRACSDTRLRRGRSFAGFAVATAADEVRRHLRESLASANHDPTRGLHERLPAAAHELSRRLGRSPRPSEIATLLDEEIDSVVEIVADDRLACLERPEDDPGGGSHPVEA